MSVTNLPLVARAYRRFPLRRRLFVLVRYLLVPWERLADAVPGPGTVLDIGCGDGLFLVLLRHRHPGMRGIGIEHDEAKLRTGRACHEPGAVELHAWSSPALAALPPVDCVTMTDVLYTVPLEQWDAVFAFARARLRPGGTLLVKETVDAPRWKAAVSLVQETVATRVLRYTKGERPHLHPPATFVEYFERHGFECRRQEPVHRGYPWSHFLLVATRR